MSSSHQQSGPPPQTPPAQYGPYLDGLFTYCLSVLCDHDAAVAALGDVLALAERQPRRRPADPTERRPWLYSLARWACLQRLSVDKPGRADRQGKPGRADKQGKPGKAVKAGKAVKPGKSEKAGKSEQQPPERRPMSEAAAHQRRRELATLAWPEAAGTTPEQREALELAVRHRLPAEEVATVVGLEPDAARVLLSTAACEVERTRAALAVVDQRHCPAIARLAGDGQLLLSATLRRELVRHVDDCPDCRRSAERAGAGWAWPGTLRAVTPHGPLPVLEAPRAAAYAAMQYALRTRPAHPPRFDRRGFPQDPRHRAARRGRMRSRVVTSTVVATVVAAPVLALWAAYRGAPPTGEAHGSWPIPSTGTEGPESLDGRPVEKAGSAQDGPSPRFTKGSRASDVSVEVIDSGGSAAARPGRPGIGPGRLTVAAQPGDGVTLITLRASGGSPVSWQASADAAWLRFSQTYGTLMPGESTTITVAVDSAREPQGSWQARVYISPGGAAILVSGRGGRPSNPPPSDPGPSDPGPSDPGPSDPSPPDPTSPPPDPSPSDPSDPPSSEPPPSSPPPDPSPSEPSPTESDSGSPPPS